MTTANTAATAANACAGKLREHLAHGARLQQFARARLRHLDDQLALARRLRWNQLHFGDPIAHTLARHAARLQQARDQTAHVIQIHHNTVALILQRARAKSVEESRCACSNSDRESQSTSDPARMTTAEWMRWRAQNLRKRR